MDDSLYLELDNMLCGMSDNSKIDSSDEFDLLFRCRKELKRLQSETTKISPIDFDNLAHALQATWEEDFNDTENESKFVFSSKRKIKINFFNEIFIKQVLYKLQKENEKPGGPV